MKKIFLLVPVLIPVLVLSACEDAVQETKAPPIRAVKTITITEASKTNSRQISGVVKTTNESALSFRVGGRVATVEVKAGDNVSEGQVLASLNQDDYALNLEQAQATLASARASLNEKQDALKRQQSLKEKDFVSQAAVDQAQTAYEAAKGDVNVAQVKLKSAQNDIDDTILLAPFAGKIAARQIDPFVEVSAGGAAFLLQNESGYGVDVLMPETIVRDVSYGDVVSVRFPTLKETVVGGTVTQIGANAGAGNAFAIEIDLGSAPKGVRPGMTAQVTFNFGEASDTAVFLIPLSALDVRISQNPSDSTKRQAGVFVVSATTSAVEKRMVNIRDIRGNELEVISGLQAGDVLVVAGVPFLTEGQTVKLWEPTYSAPATINIQ